MKKVKWRQFIISAEVLLGLGSGQFEVIASPLPADATLIDVRVSPRHEIILYVESETFEAVDRDGEIPIHTPPVIRRLAKTETK
jgi:hypothetical protein